MREAKTRKEEEGVILPGGMDVRLLSLRSSSTSEASSNTCAGICEEVRGSECTNTRSGTSAHARRACAVLLANLRMQRTLRAIITARAREQLRMRCENKQCTQHKSSIECIKRQKRFACNLCTFQELPPYLLETMKRQVQSPGLLCCTNKLFNRLCRRLKRLYGVWFIAFHGASDHITLFQVRKDERTHVQFDAKQCTLRADEKSGVSQTNANETDVGRKTHSSALL